eukprot:5545872-Amphidinium_carterae.1
MRANLDWVKPVFVGLGMTSTCQPLDNASMKPFKKALQRSCGEAFSKELLENMEQEDFVLKQGIMENRVHLVEWLAQTMDSVSIRPVLDEVWNFMSGVPSRRQLIRRLPMLPMACSFGKGVAQYRR